MTEEKRVILKKIDELVCKIRTKLINELPSIHEIDDGIIIRFFAEWNNCKINNNIRYKKIRNKDKPNENIIFFYIPKGTYIDLKQRYYISYITCLSGRIDITINNQIKQLNGYSKINIESDEIQGLALENTYLIATSDKTIR